VNSIPYAVQLPPGFTRHKHNQKEKRRKNKRVTEGILPEHQFTHAKTFAKWVSKNELKTSIKI